MLEDRFGIRFPDPGFETLGGVLFGTLGRRPQVGDEVHLDGWAFSIEEVEGLRISRVRLSSAEMVETDAAKR
jgi:CBS domain containing-hemolysin-like protein